MAWTYSDDPKTSPKDQYRFYIGDTNEKQPKMSDEEIQFMIDTYKSENAILYYLFTTLASKVAPLVSEGLGPQQVSYSDMYKHYISLATQYKQRMSRQAAPMMSVEQHAPIFDIDRIPHQQCWET